ncbi:cytochrome c1-2, heme protein, mitochondrial [Orussus abietinus]|uniref:cytochrome c1-2, heme protein, mitochondrial n=1 Tax=Orussus abietinus TaxID=222816 RepID=UPI00062686FC|nr:cytochrome c1-2, heme protein, mitochondrial [Orussus abietinus]
MASTIFRSCHLGRRLQSPRFSPRRVLTSRALALPGRSRQILKRCTAIAIGGLTACGTFLWVLDSSVKAQLEIELPNYPWSFMGLISSLDHAAVRRGWQVYKTVCATCHSLQYISYKELVNVTHTEEEARAIAEEVEIEDGPDAEGNYYTRPGKLFDRIPKPFPNDEAARAANNGALPVDLTLIVLARHNGVNHCFSVLTGFMDPPAGIELRDGQFFNAYFPGGVIGMAPMLVDGLVDYDDGTPSTVPQMAKDVSEFLTWTASREYDTRKVMFIKGIGISLMILAAYTYLTKHKWAALKTSKIAFVPKHKF